MKTVNQEMNFKTRTRFPGGINSAESAARAIVSLCERIKAAAGEVLFLSGASSFQNTRPAKASPR
jgi:hypothetical protein